MELEEKRQRARATIKKSYERRKAAGQTWGRPPAPFNLAEAIRLRGLGQGYILIGRALGVSAGTVRRRLAAFEEEAARPVAKKWWERKN